MKILNGPEVTAKLSAALKDIARLTGFSERDVTRGEAGAILKTWAGRTKIAQPEQIDVRSRSRVLRTLGLTSATEPGEADINVGIRGPAGLVWMKTRKGKFKLAGVQSFDGKKFTPANRHWTEDDWTTIRGATEASAFNLAKAMPLARQSAGLARQSIVQIADMAGINLATIPGGGISPAQVQKARQAVSSTGVKYQNGTAQENRSQAGSYYLTLINSLPYLNGKGLNMGRTLAFVLAGRVGLYKRTFANGAYKSIQSAAQNYPWMRTNLAA